MTEHPILFSSDMSRAIKDDRKTITRRVLKPAPTLTTWFEDKVQCGMYKWKDLSWFVNNDTSETGIEDYCPYGNVGDHLWVRESYAVANNGFQTMTKSEYEAIRELFKPEPNDPMADILGLRTFPDIKFIPGIFMPRKYSRITLEITGIRVERVQEITDKDSISEGMIDYVNSLSLKQREPLNHYLGIARSPQGYKAIFAMLWDKLNAKRGFGWDVNPFVWIIEFKKLEQEQ